MFGISPYTLISVYASFETYNLRCKYPKHWPSVGIEIKSHGKSGAFPLKRYGTDVPLEWRGD